LPFYVNLVYRFQSNVSGKTPNWEILGTYDVIIVSHSGGGEESTTNPAQRRRGAVYECNTPSTAKNLL
jgi:hypothetical protein